MADADGTAPRFRDFLDGMYDPSLQVQLNVHRRTSEWLAAGRRANDLLRTPDDVRRRQEELRKLALEALGGDLPDVRQVPAARPAGTVAADGHTIEKLILEIGDGVRLPANLYVPHTATAERPAGAVLFLCGHADAGKAAPRYQAMCARLARAGLVVLTYDSIGQGERKSYLDADGRELIPANVPEHVHAGVQCWWAGDTIARYFVNDARRALDYLVARPEVDPGRVGAAGNSGGGTQTTWLMLVEPRIAAAAPSCFITGREEYQRSGQAQDPEQIIPGGALAGLDHEDFLIAMAPRPTLVLSANSDFFCVEGAVRTVARAQRVVALTGGSLTHVRADGEHGLGPELAAAATEFFARHLGDGPAPAAAPAHDEPPVRTTAELQCTRTGQLATDHPDAPRVFELNRDRLARELPGDAGGIPWLHDRVMSGREPAAEFFPRWWTDPASGARKAFWWSERDIVNAAIVLDPVPGVPAHGTDLLLLDRGTEDLAAHFDACDRARAAGRRIVVLDVRGTGALAVHRFNEFGLEAGYGTLYKIVADLVCLSDSLGAARVYDVLRAVEFVRTWAAGPVRLIGAGQGAFLSVLAGALAPGVAEVVCLTPPLDPVQIVRTRFYGPERDTQVLIPGLARQCPTTQINAALGHRYTPANRWFTA
ncbi:hypothetical protein E1262_11575 [Jiangella aurantiaca]|uniref:Xaa-Pro dipeptidyl-peptidase-like domain-containing protein n=1 Tax=Jiangella aurantiaca TaxID=2530373 RepID=A0A4R5AIF7_9ACTN|nr:CocE/NonD family hydrolase [Jiangella aurantiaca]TDD69902.1 hypothetical protein E1262_11575 [Jiangella aurantiaca]